MMSLRVLSGRPELDGTSPIVKVEWSVSPTKSGVLRVRMASDVSDVAVAAELGAVHHLLTQKEVLGENRSGKGLEIIFSRGAVRKLLRKDSEKFDLSVYARYLMTRFHQAMIKVDKTPIHHESAPLVDDLLLSSPPRCIEYAPCIGWFEVTAHAIHQYSARSQTGPIHRSYNSLIRAPRITLRPCAQMSEARP